jgi:dissimilatory sulfite reductase related protein
VSAPERPAAKCSSSEAVAPNKLDPLGYLLEYSEWTPAFAHAQALADGIELSPAHWEILHFLRDYFETFAMAPPMRLLTKAIASKLGKDKGSSLYLYQLFPEGPAKQACRYAGLPKPVSCI